MINFLLSFLILAPVHTVHAHNTYPCEMLLVDFEQMQSQVWKLEAAGRLQEAAAIRIELDTWLTGASVESLRGKFAFNQQNARRDIAAVIINEELGYPVRLPATVWRRQEQASLRLRTDAEFEQVPVIDKQIFEYLTRAEAAGLAALSLTHATRLAWQNRVNHLDMVRILRRLDLWLDAAELRNFEMRMCVLRAVLNEKNPGECGTTPGRA